VSVAPSTSGDPRIAALMDALHRTEITLADFRGALRNVNREDLQVAAISALDAADALLRHHLVRPSPTIADDVAIVLAAFKQINIPNADADFGRLTNLVTLRGARGNIREDFGDVLDAANKLGWQPSKHALPDIGNTEISRDGVDAALKGLVARMEVVEQLLERVVKPQGEWTADRSPIQLSLVNVFIKDMKLELALAKVSAQGREIVDLLALGRAIGNVAELTADFVASVRGMATKMTASLQQASEQLRPKVREVAHGFRIVIRKAVSVIAWRKRADDLAEEDQLPHHTPVTFVSPPSDFNFTILHEMILKGQTPPESWWPWIGELNFNFKPLNSLAPLKSLSSLKSLYLVETQVTDLTPLANLSSLRALDLRNTRVTDLAPLAHLGLFSLDLDGTPVTDLSPLANLSLLESLDLRKTHVTDLRPLERMRSLRSLNLTDTQVTNLTPLKRLPHLSSVYVENKTRLEALTRSLGRSDILKALE
jgi:Leucine-rich repeat (LRR) protein